MLTDASQKALEILREPGFFQWPVITLFVLAIYVYAVEIERKNWNVVFSGVAFYGMDLFNEIWNGLVLHFTQRSAVWTTPGGTSYLIFAGLTIEISIMFAIMGVALVKMLPKDKSLKILGIPNRWFFAVLNSALCVFVEILLNKAGALVWEYSWWNFPSVGLVFLFGYLPFMAVSFWVHDMERIRSKLAAISVIYGVNFSAIVVFGCLLRWI